MDDRRVFRCHHPIWPGVDSDRSSDIICDLLEPLQQGALPSLRGPPRAVRGPSGRRGGKASSTLVRSLAGDKDLVCEMMPLLRTNLSQILEIRDVFVL